MELESKVVDNFENYVIYSDGSVYGKKHKKFIKQFLNNKGYKTIMLYRGKDKRKNWKVHRLVAQAFIPNPESKSCVDHIDRNPLNNAISNLRWASYSENNNNKGMYKSNKSGHTNIWYDKSKKRWTYSKAGEKDKTFKIKQEAIIWKFYQLIKIKI
tara:strand:+ start:648 stop:1115 length:468 start_codon:yes stop_codon:yes gene_type:complete